MDAKARVAIESAVHKTLHGHSFSRSSSQASIVLTDLLSRYLNVLASTCAKYAQHAGRTDLTARDAFCAMDELGVSMAELGEYCGSEAAEMGRYAVNTTRRVEELRDFRGEHNYCLLTLHVSNPSSSASFRRAQAKTRRWNPFGLCTYTRRCPAPGYRRRCL